MGDRINVWLQVSLRGNCVSVCVDIGDWRDGEVEISACILVRGNLSASGSLGSDNTKTIISRRSNLA